MTDRRGNPYVWATWLPPLMLGDKTCAWALWHMANYSFDKIPENTDFTQWRIDHTRLVRRLADQEEASGNSVLFEDQAEFRYRRPSGLVLHGKPDLVSEGRDTVTVIEAKVGKIHDRDIVQTKLYMYGLRNHYLRFAGREIDGRVVYLTGEVVDVPAYSADKDFEAALHDWIEMIEQPSPARKVPSEQNCRFCKISPRDCPERVTMDHDEDL